MVNINNPLGIAYYDALEAKYKAEVATAEAHLTTYFNAPVGIGEHSDLVTEFDIWVDKLANAKDKLATIAEFRNVVAPGRV